MIPVFIDESEDADLPTFKADPGTAVELPSEITRDGETNRTGSPKPLQMTPGARRCNPSHRPLVRRKTKLPMTDFSSLLIGCAG